MRTYNMENLIPFKQEKIYTEVHNIISHDAACQAGKTTWAIKHILDNLSTQDHIFFTFNLKEVLTDTIDKFEKECEKRGITVPIITDKKGIIQAYRRRTKGNMTPIVAFLLGNISNMSRAKTLLSMKNTTNFMQNVYLDEIHRYTLGEDVGERAAQIDNFVNEIYENNQCGRIYTISATGHDLLYSKLNFKKTIVLPGYKDFRSISDADWVIIPKEEFENILDVYKTYKKNGILENVCLPTLAKAMDQHVSEDTLANIHSEQNFHDVFWPLLCEKNSWPKMTAYNANSKGSSGNLVGKLSMGVSRTFSQNKIVYYTNIKSRTASIATIMQELGRVNGTKYPVIITTQEIKDAVDAYLKYYKAMEKERVFQMPWEERHAWLNKYEHEFPKLLPSNKHKVNRCITTTLKNREGKEENCNEDFYELYAPDLCEEKWEGREIGLKILEAIKEKDPALYSKIEGRTYITDTDTRREKDGGGLWIKHREIKGALIRFGKQILKKGYIAIAIRRSLLPSTAFYSLDGVLISNEKGQEVGTVASNVIPLTKK